MAGAIVLWAAAAVMFGIAPALCLVLAIRGRIERRADAKRRAEQDRELTPEWLAVLAATDTPIFAEVWAESLRRDLKEL